ncbi:MAG: IS701 family transposase [Hyphomicrobiales bacterium]|nr:IS701 family transposase [Hyphomicrobiales bacterium]
MSDAISLLLHGAHSSGRAEERRADSGPRRAPPRPRRASVAAPFCRQRRLVAGGPAATGSNLCSACDREERQAWIVDDTGFPKKGVHSVGVARQYCGQLGKQDNCQIAVSLSAANEHASPPIGFRLYLPEDWAVDPVRRARAGVPEDVVFKTKPQIALDQIKAARAEGVPEGVVLADAGYGINTTFRMALTRMGLTYVVGIQSSARLWPPGSGPLTPKAWSGQGRAADADATRRAQPASIG